MKVIKEYKFPSLYKVVTLRKNNIMTVKTVKYYTLDGKTEVNSNYYHKLDNELSKKEREFLLKKNLNNET